METLKQCYKPMQRGGINVGCALGMIVGVVGITVALYAGLGTLGWRMIGQYVDYEDKYYEALSFADADRDGDISTAEAERWVADLGVTRMPNQTIVDVKPAYDSLCEYLELREMQGLPAERQ